MNQERERRRHSRYQASLEIVAQEVGPAGTPDPTATCMRGVTRNLSESGFCVLLDQACHVSSLLRCEISLAGYPVAVPTLAHVRWTQNGQRAFVAGVEFLL